jgi:hypothetical protein
LLTSAWLSSKKGKVVLVHAMKTWGVEVWLHSCLTSALDGGECSTSRPGRFFTEKNSLAIEQKAGWAAEPVWMFWRGKTVMYAVMSGVSFVSNSREDAGC